MNEDVKCLQWKCGKYNNLVFASACTMVVSFSNQYHHLSHLHDCSSWEVGNQNVWRHEFSHSHLPPYWTFMCMCMQLRFAFIVLGGGVLANEKCQIQICQLWAICEIWYFWLYSIVHNKESLSIFLAVHLFTGSCRHQTHTRVEINYFYSGSKKCNLKICTVE